MTADVRESVGILDEPKHTIVKFLRSTPSVGSAKELLRFGNEYFKSSELESKHFWRIQSNVCDIFRAGCLIHYNSSRRKNWDTNQAHWNLVWKSLVLVSFLTNHLYRADDKIEKNEYKQISSILKNMQSPD